MRSDFDAEAKTYVNKLEHCSMLYNCFPPGQNWSSTNGQHLQEYVNKLDQIPTEQPPSRSKPIPSAKKDKNPLVQRNHLLRITSLRPLKCNNTTNPRVERHYYARQVRAHTLDIKHIPSSAREREKNKHQVTSVFTRLPNAWAEKSAAGRSAWHYRFGVVVR